MRLPLQPLLLPVCCLPHWQLWEQEFPMPCRSLPCGRSGGRFHAGLKAATAEQMEKTVSDSRVKDYTWNIFISVAENLNKRQYEIRMPQGEEELENSFIKLEQGTMPQKEEDIMLTRMF